MYFRIVLVSFYENIRNIFKSHPNKGFEIPTFLLKRKISTLDVGELQDLFRRNNISYFYELTPEMLKEYIRYSYPSAMYVIKILGLYGVNFLSDKLKKYSFPNSSNSPIFKFPRTNDNIIVKDSSNYEKVILQRFFFDMKFFTNFVLDGIKEDVFLNMVGISKEKLTELIEIEYYSLSDNIYDYKTKNDFKEGIIEATTTPVNLTNQEEVEEKATNQQYSLFDDEEITKNLNNTDNSTQDISIEYLELSNRSYHALKSNNIKTLKQLLQLSYAELLRIPNIGRKSLKEIIDEREKYRNNFAELIELEKEKKQKEIIQVPINIADINLIETDLSPRLHHILESNNIIYIRDILPIPSKEILDFKNMGRKSYNELCYFLKKYNLALDMDFAIEGENNTFQIKTEENEIKPLDNKARIPSITPENLFKAINAFESKYCDGSRKFCIYHERIKNKKKTTLQTLGDKFEVTRERIRQIETSLLRKLGFIIKHHKSIFYNLFDRYGNIISYENIPELQPLDGYFELLKNVIHSECNNYFYIDTDLKIISKLETDIDEITIEKTDKVSYKLEEIQNEISCKLKEFVFNEDEYSEFNFNALLKIFVKFNLEENFNYDEAHSQYLLKGKDSSRLSDAFKKCYPKGVLLHQDAEEIYANIIKKCENIEVSSPRALIARLLNSENIILTNPGFYQHIDSISIPSKDVLDFAIQKCKEKLDADKTPFLITVIYERYKEYFQEKGIFSEYLLFSLLKREYSCLKFSRLTICSNDQNITTQVDLFENFFKDHKGIIPIQEVEDYFHSLGWVDTSIYNYLNNSNTVYKLTSGYFHKDNVYCDFDRLNNILNKIDEKIHESGFASLDIIKKQNFSDWIEIFEHKNLDIKSMAMVLRAFCPEYKADLSGIITTDVMLTPGDALYKWINKKCIESGWVASQQIFDFCDKNGFHRYNTRNLIKNKLAEICDNGWISYDYAGINSDTEQKVLELVYSKLKEFGANYITIQKLCDKTDLQNLLPKLENNCMWNEYLVKSLIERLPDVILYNFVVVSPYQNQIKTKDQIVADEIKNFTKTWFMSTEKLEKLLRCDHILNGNETLSHKSVRNELFNEQSCLELKDADKNVCIKPEYR